jgi:phosphohistidine phosphatase
MRYLTVVRHAKAVKGEPGEPDYGRVLHKRGRAQCEQLREWATDPNALSRFGPTTALVSAAARTRETYARAFEGTGFVQTCHFSELIYNGRRHVTAEDVLIDLAAVDPVTTSLLVVGHNPTVHELVLTLARVAPPVLRTGNYPLGGAYVLELPDDHQIGLARYDVVDSFIPD